MKLGNLHVRSFCEHDSGVVLYSQTALREYTVRNMTTLKWGLLVVGLAFAGGSVFAQGDSAGKNVDNKTFFLWLLKTPKKAKNYANSKLTKSNKHLSEQSQALTRLIRRLRTSNQKLKITTLNNIGKMGPNAADALSSLLFELDSKSWEVRTATIRTIGKIGTKARTSIPRVLKALAKDKNAAVRKMAAWTLSRIGLGTTKPTDGLIKALKDSNDWVREAAAEALGDMGQASKVVLNALQRTLLDPSLMVRRAAEESLVQLGSKARKLLESMLRSSSWRKRKAAAWCLYRFGLKAAPSLPSLVKALRDSNPYVQEAAISAIGEMRVLASSALGSLMPLLRNRRKWIRHAAVVSVGKIGPEAKRALPILRRLLRSSSLRTKNAIRQALGQIEGR